MNASGVEALAAFECVIDQTGWSEALWASKRLAADEVDRAMRQAVGARLGIVFDAAAGELRRIDTRLEVLASELPARVWPTMPDEPAPRSAIPPAEQPVPVGRGEPAVIAVPLRQFGALVRNAQDVLQEGERQVLKAPALRGGLRKAASAHLRSRWMDGQVEPPSVLAQVDAKFITIADEARGLVV